MKKVIVMITALIIVLVGGLIIYNKLFKYNYKISQIKEYNYFISKQDNKYGVIDKNANIIIENKYTNIIIPNPEKDVFICFENDKSIVLNSKNVELFGEYEKIEPIKLKNVASALSYEKSILIYKKDGKYGLINFGGKEITKNIYASIENLQPTEGKFLVSKDNKYGVIDLNGNVIIKTEYDNIKSDEFYTENEGYLKSGFILLNKTVDGYKYGYINYKGKKILDVDYNEIERISKENTKDIYLIVSENGKYGIVNKSKNIIPNEYQEITYEEDLNVFIVKKSKKYGAIDITGKIIIDTKYDEITANGIYLYAKESNENKVFDTKGNKVDINFNKYIYKTDNEQFRISVTLNNDILYYGIQDKSGTQLVKDEYKYIEYLYDNCFIATDDNGKLGIINSNGRVILEFKYDFLQKLKNDDMIQAISDGAIEYYTYNLEKIENYSENKRNTQYTGFPDKIGDYTKEQITLESVYYIKY